MGLRDIPRPPHGMEDSRHNTVEFSGTIFYLSLRIVEHEQLSRSCGWIVRHKAVSVTRINCDEHVSAELSYAQRFLNDRVRAAPTSFDRQQEEQSEWRLQRGVAI